MFAVSGHMKGKGIHKRVGNDLENHTACCLSMCVLLCVDCVLICDKESVEVIEDKYAFNGQYNKEYYSRLN